MKKIYCLMIALFFSISVFTQVITNNPQSINLKPSYIIQFIAGDLANIFYYEGPKTGTKDAAAAPKFLLKFNANGKPYSYERFPLTFEQEEILEIYQGIYANDKLYIFYKAKVKADKKYAFLIGEFEKTGKQLKSTVLQAVAKEEELAKLNFYFSSDKKYLCITTPKELKLLDAGFNTLYTKTISYIAINQINVTTKGEVLLLAVKGTSLQIVKYDIKGASSEIDADYGPGICSVLLKVNESNNTIYLSKILGKTSSLVLDVINNFENKVDAKGLSIGTFDFISLNKTDEIKVDFSDDVLSKIGMMREFINWLSMDDMYFNAKGEMLLVMQKRYVKKMSLSSIEKEVDYMVGEDILLVKIGIDKSVSQCAIERNMMKKPGDYDYMIKPVVFVQGNSFYLFSYTTKSSSGGYKDQMDWCTFDEKLTIVNPKSYMVESKNLHIEFSSAIKLNENSYWISGHFSSNIAGSVKIEF